MAKSSKKNKATKTESKPVEAAAKTEKPTVKAAEKPAATSSRSQLITPSMACGAE